MTLALSDSTHEMGHDVKYIDLPSTKLSDDTVNNWYILSLHIIDHNLTNLDLSPSIPQEE
jgi:hypothetical protein